MTASHILFEIFTSDFFIQFQVKFLHVLFWHIKPGICFNTESHSVDYLLLNKEGIEIKKYDISY